MKIKVCLFFLMSLLVSPSAAQHDAVAAQSIAKRIALSRRADGGYGADGQESAPAFTYFAVRSLALLGLRPTNEAACVSALKHFAEDGAGGSRPERRLAWIHDALLELGRSLETPASLTPLPELPRLSAWIGSDTLEDFAVGLRLRRALNEPIEPAALVPALLGYWRGRDGGYAYPTPLSEAYPFVSKALNVTTIPTKRNGPSSLGSTAFAIESLLVVGAEIPEREALVTFVRASRTPGGFYRSRQGTHALEDLYSTYLALKSLHDLGVPPEAPERTRAAVLRLWCEGGGFSHSAKEPFSLEATWLALECLRFLGVSLPPMTGGTRGTLPAPSVEPGLSVFQAIVEIGPDAGVVAALAPRAGADLVLLKGEEGVEPELVRAVERIAKARGIPLHAACITEEHRRAWGVEGLGYVTHCSDVIYAPTLTRTPRDCFTSLEAIRASWDLDRAKGARVFSCSYVNRELLAPAYAAFSEEESAYDGLMGAWAFAPDGDLIRERPWLQRYVGWLPIIGNHDAHGDPFHWFHRGLRTRTLFIAKTGDLDGLRDALDHNRIVAVAHGAKRTAFYGHPHWVAMVKEQEARARWDRGRPANAEEPWLPDPVIIPIDQASATELPSLRSGYGVLVRAAMGLGDEAFPSEVSLWVDGEAVPLAVVPPRADRRDLGLWAPLPKLSPGVHRFEVSFRSRRFSEALLVGAPVTQPVEVAPLPTLGSVAEFDRFEDVLRIRGPIQRMDAPDGTFGLHASRADVFLDRPRDDVVELDVGFMPGAGTVEVFLNGHRMGVVMLRDAPASARFQVGPSVLVEGIQRVSFRTELAGWIASFNVPSTVIRLDRVGLVPARGVPR